MQLCYVGLEGLTGLGRAEWKTEDLHEVIHIGPVIIVIIEQFVKQIESHRDENRESDEPLKETGCAGHSLGEGEWRCHCVGDQSCESGK